MNSIVSTTLFKNNQEIIAEALKSVLPLVDKCVLINTGSSDATEEIARRVVGDKGIFVNFEWCDSFADARNHALDVARQSGHQWAITCDSDERIVSAVDVEGLRRTLSRKREASVWLSSDCRYGYNKERIINLSHCCEWIGRTHECLADVPIDQRELLKSVEFYEVPKRTDELQRKLLRDIQILKEDVQQFPSHARWWYFLGQTLELLERNTEAVDAYRRNAELSQSDEEIAWSAFCIARCHIKSDDLIAALKECAEAIHAYAFSPELAWLAGKCALKLGKYRDAITWARLAISIAKDEQADRARVGFRHLPAWHEAPWNVVRLASESIGNHKDAESAMVRFAQSLSDRRKRSRMDRR